MEIFIRTLLNGLALGMAYALIAVGFSLVFGILRLINFSHSAVYTFGAYMVFLFYSINAGLVSSIALSIVLSGVLAVVVNKVALEPLRKNKSIPIATLVTTIGLSYIIQNVLALEIVFSSSRRPFPGLNLFGNLQFGHITIQSSQVIMFFTAVGLLLLLSAVVHRTKIGLAMRATEQNIKAAYLMGIDVNKIITFTFFISGASAAIAATLISGYYQIITPTMGAIIGLKAFSAAVVGGIGILYGSIVGGLVIGVAECFAAQFLGSNVRDPMAFVILIAILIIKPYGLFGKKGVVKV